MKHDRITEVPAPGDRCPKHGTFLIRLPAGERVCERCALKWLDR